MSFVQKSGEPAAAPSRYDLSPNLSMPDVGSIESTNTVSGFVGPLAKVVVSLYLTHPRDADLTNISLIAPDGTTVLLSSANGGTGTNYGIGCSPDASRTTFDDAALVPVTSGVAPFVGSFQPQSSLGAFIINPTPNGNWRLHIADGFAGSVGTLRCWSLFLYGTACASGNGSCGYCLTSINGSLSNADLLQTNRMSKNAVPTSCGAPKPWPGTTVDGSNHYRVYAFTNTTASPACVTALLTASCDVQSAIYLYAFDPVNITNNYIADSGGSTGSGLQSCSASIPPGAPFFVTVNEVTPGAGCSGYTLQLSGLPCPPPTLNIQPLTTNRARLFWTTAAGGYLLEAESNLVANAWSALTNEPLVNSGNYNVTNSSIVPTNRFFRLLKP
jgi:subtilisin-like proprotein convertase family protein